MAETARDARYRQAAHREHERAERYRDLLLATVVLALRGVDLGSVDWAEHLSPTDLAEVARRRRTAQNGSRSG